MDSGNKDIGAMDFVDAGPLASCEKGNRTVRSDIIIDYYHHSLLSGDDGLRVCVVQRRHTNIPSAFVDTQTFLILL